MSKQDYRKAHKKAYELPRLAVGDVLLVGKFKNRKATITGFSSDENNRPVAGGPCCGMAAFAAMREGAPVRIFEKSAFPRHKVRGEFLSPAILPLLRRAGCEAGFLQLRPAVLSAMRRHFGTRVIRHPLPEHAASAGAQVVREHWSTAAQEVTVILAAGRRSIAPALATVFSGSRPTSAALSTTASDPSAFTPAISSGVAPRSPSACALRSNY
jgi:hypothetical protein